MWLLLVVPLLLSQRPSVQQTLARHLHKNFRLVELVEVHLLWPTPSAGMKMCSIQAEQGQWMLQQRGVQVSVCMRVCCCGLQCIAWLCAHCESATADTF